MRGLAKLAIPLLGLAAFTVGVGSASADECKTYIKTNYMHAKCDYAAHHKMWLAHHQAMMAHHHKMAMHHKMMHHKAVHHKMVHKKKKKATT